MAEKKQHDMPTLTTVGITPRRLNGLRQRAIEERRSTTQQLDLILEEQGIEEID